MPCLFFTNFPQGKLHRIDPSALIALRSMVAEAAGVGPEYVELHFDNVSYTVALEDGELTTNHGVHVAVEMYNGRSDEALGQMARAIHVFLETLGLGRGSDISFRELPAGSFFYEGKLVAGGLPRR